MIEIKLPNGVTAVSSDFEAKAVFRTTHIGQIEFRSDQTVMSLWAYFASAAKRIFNLTKCDHCQTWSKVKDNCGNCLRAERDIAEYNLKQERSKFELEEKNLAAANERILGLEKLIKDSHAVSIITIRAECSCAWEVRAEARGPNDVSQTRKQTNWCWLHPKSLGLMRYYTNIVPKDCYIIFNPNAAFQPLL